MKNLFLFIAIVSIAWACGDNECTQADWVGTYDLGTIECTDSTVTFSDELVILAGADLNTLVIEGDSTAFNDCSVNRSTIFGTITLELNGDNIDVEGLGCTGEYTRR